MSKILVFLQQSGGKLPKTSLIAIQAARELQSKWQKQGLVGVVGGEGAEAAATAALKYGLSEVYFSDDAALKNSLAVLVVELLHVAAEKSGADTVVATGTSVGRDILPRFAVRFGAGQASDVVGVNADGSLKRPMYAGNVFADVELLTARKIVSVRATAFQPATEQAGGGAVIRVSLPPIGALAGTFVSAQLSGGGRPELGDAPIVVSGGRALQSSENFEKVLFPLADVLQAAVGASRAAVDSGYAPNDWQVGQTGKVVAPSLYIAVGISGAIQHLAGMKDSKVIVAINKDPDAPIFEVADFGLVADLFQVVPALVEEIKKSRG